MIGGLEFEVYRSIRSVFVIRISVENESGAFRHTPTASAATPFWRCLTTARVSWFRFRETRWIDIKDLSPGWGKLTKAVRELHQNLRCTVTLMLSFLKGSERRALEHHSIPPEPSTNPGMPPIANHIPAHSDPQTLVSVSEYNYLVR